VRSPQDRELRYARSCYDHLAGELGVAVALALEDRGLIATATHGKRVEVTSAGAALAARRVGHRFAPAEARPAWVGMGWHADVWTGQSGLIAWPGRSALECSCYGLIGNDRFGPN
jgi:hypothetical protein